MMPISDVKIERFWKVWNLNRHIILTVITRIAPIFFIVPLLLILLSCSSITNIVGSKRERSLEATLSTYQTAMRWGYWDTLLSYRNTASASPLSADEFSTVQVTAYEVRQPPVFIKKDRVLQIVEIQYVHTNQQRLRKMLDKQEWSYDTDQELWQLYSPFPSFR